MKTIFISLLAVFTLIGIAFVIVNIQKPIPVKRYLTTTPELDAQTWVSLDPVNRFWGKVANTGSMKPEIRDDDCAVFFKNQTPSVGDVVSLNYSSTYPNLLHRVIIIEGNRIRTSGDNNRFQDCWSDLSSVKGVLSHVYSK